VLELLRRGNDDDDDDDDDVIAADADIFSRSTALKIRIFFGEKKLTKKKGKKSLTRRHKILRGESVNTFLPSRCEIIETDRRIESSGRIVFLFSLVNFITTARCYF